MSRDTRVLEQATFEMTVTIRKIHFIICKIFDKINFRIAHSIIDNLSITYR